MRLKRLWNYLTKILIPACKLEYQENGGSKMHGLVDFKTNRQMNEFQDDKLNEKVKNIAVLLAFYSWNFFNKRLIITDILRTHQEQNHVYRDSAKYKKKPWRSVHEFWRGVDIRSHGLTDKEIKILVTIANTIEYDKNRPNKKTCLYHSVGKGGKHIHLQVFISS